MDKRINKIKWEKVHKDITQTVTEKRKKENKEV